MMQRLYVHNYKCFENFELKLGDTPSALLIGKNGSGKSSVAAALGLLQAIGRGVNRGRSTGGSQRFFLRPGDCADAF